VTYKESIKDMIVEMGEENFFTALVQAMKDREITEWVAAGEDFNDAAYDEYRNATVCASLLASRVMAGNGASAKRKV
jgi:hypothetical protein